jgi:translation initiation factor IF-1
VRRQAAALPTEHEIIAHTAGPHAEESHSCLGGHKVLCEMTPYDLARGRITYRVK